MKLITWTRIRTPLLSGLAGLSVAQADDARFTVDPKSFVPGKTYTIAIKDADTRCGTDTDTAKSDLGDATKDKILVSGSGMTITPPNPLPAHKCDWTGTLTVSTDAETGSFNLVVETPAASFLTPISVVAKAAGPIPPGLQPSVDVAWSVLPKRVSSDNFGGRITKLYYPIQVVIGNNSGYDLQLASVQFKLPDAAALDSNVPTDSYYLVRTSLQREQLIGVRNTTVNVIKAIGPILTGSTVFFDGSSAAALNHKRFFQGFTGVFSNPFEKGLELVFPDQTVQQLINLDNHTLRDGVIIANNTQIRTVVFVNRDFLTRSAASIRTANASRSAAAAKSAASDTANARRTSAAEVAAADKMAAAEIAAADQTLAEQNEAAERAAATEIVAARRTLAQKIAAAGALADANAAAVARREAAEEAQNAETAAAEREAATKEAASRLTLAIKTGATERAAAVKAESIRTAGADRTVANTNALLDKNIAATNRKTEKALGGNGKFGKHEYDQQEVMKQLGSLQLVGRSIAYLNRVSVISNPLGAGPQFTMSPASTTQGNNAIALTLTGDALAGGALTAVPAGLGISNQSVGTDGKSFTATLDASKADPGIYTLTLKTPSASQSAQFEVKAAAITISPNPPNPPLSVKAGTAAATFTINGTFLKNVSKVTDCAGVEVTSFTPNADGTLLTINFSAASAQVDPNCKLTVTGKAGETPTVSYAVTQ